MTIPNTPISDILMNMPVDHLYEYRAALQTDLMRAQARAKVADAAISARFNDRMQDAYNRADKSHGTVRIDLGDGFEVRGDVSKTVSWDQPRLRAIAAGMDWCTAQHFFNITFKVPEKVYDGLPPDDPRKKQFDDARTVKYGDGKITLERKGG